MAGEREHVAIFNPLTLPLPAWHPDGPDGKVDGFVIPFVVPASGRSVSVDELAGDSDNRRARITIGLDARIGWSATTENFNAWRAYTAEQARALAAAWIRAAEVLDNVGANTVVDAEIIDDDDEGQAASPYASDNPGPDQPGHVHQDCCK